MLIDRGFEYAFFGIPRTLKTSLFLPYIKNLISVALVWFCLAPFLRIISALLILPFLPAQISWVLALEFHLSISVSAYEDLAGRFQQWLPSDSFFIRLSAWLLCFWGLRRVGGVIQTPWILLHMVNQSWTSYFQKDLEPYPKPQIHRRVLNMLK